MIGEKWAKYINIHINIHRLKLLIGEDESRAQPEVESIRSSPVFPVLAPSPEHAGGSLYFQLFLNCLFFFIFFLHLLVAVTLDYFAAVW